MNQTNNNAGDVNSIILPSWIPPQRDIRACTAECLGAALGLPADVKVVAGSYDLPSDLFYFRLSRPLTAAESERLTKR
jgi:hypothetical protein